MGYFTDPIDDLMLGWRYFQEQHPDWFDKDHSVGVDSSSQARRAKENNMSKKIAAGDTLTVWDLTDDYLGAEIEVGPIEGMRTRMTLDRIEEAYTDVLRLFTPDGGYKAVSISRPVKIITPPPAVQPDEPTILGQCIRIEGDDEFRGVVADPGSVMPIVEHRASWRFWGDVLRRAGDRQIIVSDPPRWPDGDDGPKPGDTFDRIEDMPYGWIAKVTRGDGGGWGYVVRYDDGQETHRWDIVEGYSETVTSDWQPNGARTISGGNDENTTYTLVETVSDHDSRVAPSLGF